MTQSKGRLTVEARSKARQAIVAQADRRARALTSIIAEIRAHSYSGIAVQLQARGIPTARGGRWAATRVRDIVPRIPATMLDESCGMAVQLALDGTRAIATLDLRIDYQKPALAGVDLRAHSVCTRVARSIAFVHSTAYQESEDEPVATGTACFMIGANQTNMLTDWPKDAVSTPTLEAPEDPAGPFANSPFARCLGIRLQEDGTWTMPFSPKLIGSPILPTIHGGMTGAFLETHGLGAAAPPKD
jgi:acyl-coenzyme A thioesterase PaaI-like protein